MKTFTAKEVAEMLKISAGTVGSLISSGELVAMNCSRSPSSQRPRFRVTEQALAEFLAKRAVVPAAQ